jgi:hypothetical protein
LAFVVSLTQHFSCDGRVVKAIDSKSIGLCPHRFESCSQRHFFASVALRNFFSRFFISSPANFSRLAYQSAFNGERGSKSLQLRFKFTMSRVVKISFVLLVLAGIAYSQKEPADELSKEEIYNINTDMYCQTELVINEKLLDVANPVNTYTSILGDDIKDIDCEAILKEYVIRVHKRLRKDFRKKGAAFKSLNCFMSRIEELGYDKMRMKFNALYGLELEKNVKDQFRKAINEEISDAIDIAVNECWPEETSDANLTKSAGNGNDL